MALDGSRRGCSRKARLDRAYLYPCPFHPWCERVCSTSVMSEAPIEGPEGVVRRPSERESRWTDGPWGQKSAEAFEDPPEGIRGFDPPPEAVLRVVDSARSGHVYCPRPCGCRSGGCRSWFRFQTRRTSPMPVVGEVRPWPEYYFRPSLRGRARPADLARPPTVVTWLILPVVICLSQRLSHACLSISNCTAKLRMAH